MRSNIEQTFVQTLADKDNSTMKKHFAEKGSEQKKEQPLKKESIWKTIRKFLLYWSKVDPKL
ncbi:MAG: hypothetical protein ACHQNT_04835 [Bacteroidia bacterium]